MSSNRLPIAGHHASLMIAILMSLQVVSLAGELMLWVVILSFCAVLVRVALFMGWYNHAPSVRTINLLGLLSTLALAWLAQSEGLLLSMLNLLTIACSLKLMMMTQRSDFLQLFSALLFLLGCGFIFAQTYIALVMYMGLLTLSLLSLYSAFAPSMRLGHQLSSLFSMMLKSLPIAVLLFLIIPQLPPLWKMPSAKESQTGLAETVTPGDIAALSRSSEAAFTVTFFDQLPDLKTRYFRAITMEKFDGKTWSVSPIRKSMQRQQLMLGQPFNPVLDGPAINYEIIAEVTGQQWLYSIDIAQPSNQSTKDMIWRGYDYQVVSKTPVMSKRVYQLTSFTQAPLNVSFNRFDQSLNTKVPERGNPQTQQWVDALRAQYPDNWQFTQAIMRYFANNAFRYTLEPSPMPSNPVDTFLFQERAGFCAHYAGAMAYALRLGGIPARLVTGYHGGEEIAPNVFTIRQYDAHAWVEAWLDDTGWIRFDPTSVVSPDRINLGLRQALENAGESYNTGTLDALYQSDFFQTLRMALANMDYLWSKWVLGFDASTQKDLFESILGDLSAWKVSLFLIACIGIVALLLFFYFYYPWQKRALSEESRLYLQACALVAQRTQLARNTMGASKYYEKVRDLLPNDAKATFNRITKRYIAGRYKATSELETKSFKRDIKRLKRQINNKKPA